MNNDDKKSKPVSLCFAGLVVMARSLNPIPFRTRPLNSSAPMVLWLKPWESRSPPGLQRTKVSSFDRLIIKNAASFLDAAFFCVNFPRNNMSSPFAARFEPEKHLQIWTQAPWVREVARSVRRMRIRVLSFRRGTMLRFHGLRVWGCGCTRCDCCRKIVCREPPAAVLTQNHHLIVTCGLLRRKEQHVPLRRKHAICYNFYGLYEELIDDKSIAETCWEWYFLRLLSYKPSFREAELSDTT